MSHKKIIPTFILTFFISVSLFAQHNKVPVTDKFTITGLVKNEMIISLKQLLQYNQDTIGGIQFTNKHGEAKESVKSMKGVLLRTLLDSAGIAFEKQKEYSQCYIILTASDNYTNVYSWNELFNNETGNHVYIITEMDGKTVSELDSRILAVSLSDFNKGRRHLKGLAKIEVCKSKTP